MAADLTNANSLLPLLGSFWSRDYDGVATIQARIAALLGSIEQVAVDLRTAELCVARETTPTARPFRWHRLVLDPTQAVVMPRVLSPDGLRIGDGQATIGELDPDPTYPSYGVVDCDVLTDQLLRPGLALFRGMDWTLENGRLRFLVDPCLSGQFAAPIEDEAENAHAVAIWAYRGAIDHEDQARLHGSVLGVIQPSSDRYRDFLTAMGRSLTGGTALAELEAALAAICDVPTPTGDETVTHVIRDRRGLAIATDQRVYRFSDAAQPVVAVGDRVSAGQPLVDTITLSRFQYGTVPPDLETLVLGPGFLDPRLEIAELGFPNRPVALRVQPRVLGRTRLSFELTGRPRDVQVFFDELHARGVAADYSLASLMDQRPQPLDEPKAGSLPTTINPLQFLIDNVLAGSALLARLRLDGLGSAHLSLPLLGQLRRMMAPWTALFFVIELPTIADVEDDGPDDLPPAWSGGEPIPGEDTWDDDRDGPVPGDPRPVCPT